MVQVFSVAPFFFVAPEDRGGQLQHGPASIWQTAEVMAIVQRTREATRSSAFACELRAADSPRPLAFISNLCHLSSCLVHGWPRLQRKGDFSQYSGPLRHSCTCGKQRRILRGIAHSGHFATRAPPLFLVGFWATVLEAASKTLGDGVSIQKESDQDCGDEAKAILEWVTRLSLTPDSLMDSFGKFMVLSFPDLAGGSSHLPSSHPSPRVDPSVEGSSSMVSSSTTSPAEGDFGSWLLSLVCFFWSGWCGATLWLQRFRARWCRSKALRKSSCAGFRGWWLQPGCWCWRRVWTLWYGLVHAGRSTVTLERAWSPAVSLQWV